MKLIVSLTSKYEHVIPANPDLGTSGEDGAHSPAPLLDSQSSWE